METLNILITGASGCIGHYVVDRLLQETPHNLYVLVRNPQKLQVTSPQSDRLVLLEGDLKDLAPLSDRLPLFDWGILMATAWGNPQETYDVNVTQTVKLIEQLFAHRCRHIFYFSTASLLDRSNQLLPQARDFGTDYIRTKYLCYRALEQSPHAERITVFFPTLVFGGDAQKPLSHLSSGLSTLIQWLWLIRMLRWDASFHFLHAADIAQVVVAQLEQMLQDSADAAVVTEPGLKQIILGNSALYLQDAIAQLCQHFKLRIWVQIPLFPALTDFIIWAFRIRLAPWDRFCITYRHFTYAQAISPRHFGRQPYAETIVDIVAKHPEP